jgi:hypothetical protein
MASTITFVSTHTRQSASTNGEMYFLDPTILVKWELIERTKVCFLHLATNERVDSSNKWIEVNEKGANRKLQ